MNKHHLHLEPEALEAGPEASYNVNYLKDTMWQENQQPHLQRQESELNILELCTVNL